MGGSGRSASPPKLFGDGHRGVLWGKPIQHMFPTFHNPYVLLIRLAVLVLHEEMVIAFVLEQCCVYDIEVRLEKELGLGECDEVLRGAIIYPVFLHALFI